MHESLPAMYGHLAAWWPLLSPPEDYVEEAALFAALFQDHADGPMHTLLELGSGGGNNAFHLKHSFHLLLTDLSPAMLEVSRELNPECEHHQADMRMLRLGRTFDAVLLHDAASYLCTEDDLRATLATVRAHLRPGGVALFAPDDVSESFMEKTVHGGSDDGLRGARYLQWVHDPDPDDTTYLMDFAYLLRHEDGRVETLHDRHVCGLFSKDLWLSELTQFGFTPHCLQDHWGRDIFVAQFGAD